jgi:phosphinothricin acetyltransferase
VKIRDAGEGDLPAIVAIFNAAIATRTSVAMLAPVTVEERLPWFRRHAPDRYPLWVMDDDGRVAGWLSIHRFIQRSAYDGTAEVSVYIHESWQRRGLATQLLQHAINRGPALGFHAFVGYIFGHNEPSLRFFNRMGFERWGLLPEVARLEERKPDLVIVGRHLAAA